MLEVLDTVIAFAVLMLGISVIITIITQVGVALFGLRASNLRWGLQRLLENVDPKLKKFAGSIVDKALRHPLITATDKRQATVVRKDEFVDVLHEMAQSPDSGLTPEAQQALKESLAAQQAGGGRILHWFSTVMDRVTERFVIWTRSISIIASFLVAVALHLDALALLKQFSINKFLRENLVQVSTSVMEQSRGYLESPLSSTSSMFSESFDRLREKNPALSLPTPPPFRTAVDAEQWLRQNLPDTSQARTAVREFGNLVEDLWAERAKSWRQTAFAINDSLRNTGFQLIPKDYAALKYGWREMVGLLLSGVLLSLGAPFWYNAMRHLMNLRPVLARKVEQEGGQSSP